MLSKQNFKYMVVIICLGDLEKGLNSIKIQLPSRLDLVVSINLFTDYWANVVTNHIIYSLVSAL